MKIQLKIQKVNEDFIAFSGVVKLSVMYPKQLVCTYIAKLFCIILTGANLLVLHGDFKPKK